MGARKSPVVIAAFILAMGAALAVDVPVSRWVHDSGIGTLLNGQYKWVQRSIRVFGDFRFFTLISAAILLILHRSRAAAAVVFSGIFSGSNGIVKWLVGRYRPFNGGGVFQMHPFDGGIHGLFGPNQSFPSGDVCLAAATAISLIFFVAPRWRWTLVIVITLVAIERVMQGSHYPSDTVAGAGLGWLCAIAARECVRRIAGGGETSTPAGA
jgi:membrane-associated phospholipid phosphatase